jgi:hypothetical protein
MIFPVFNALSILVTIVFIGNCGQIVLVMLPEIVPKSCNPTIANRGNLLSGNCGQIVLVMLPEIGPKSCNPTIANIGNLLSVKGIQI